MSGDWFGPKRIGFGIRPQTWQGWAVLLLFAIVLVVLGIELLPGGNVVGFVIGVIVAIIVFSGIVAVTRKRE